MQKSINNQQLSLLVLSEDATSVTGENAAVFTGAEGDSGIIVNIDQALTFENATVKVALPDGNALPTGTYYVRIGGEAGSDNKAFKAASFTVGSTAKKVLVGDADGSGALDSLDFGEIGLFLVDKGQYIKDDPTTGKNDNYYASAYCDGKLALNSLDFGELGLYLVDKVDADTTLINTQVEIGSITE